MRRGNNPAIIINENTVVGVSLSADFCAEHEWGIAGIKHAFGISESESVYGIQRRTITKVPGSLAWVSYTKEKERWEGFIYRSFYFDSPSKAASQSSELVSYKSTLAAAWSEDDFAVVSSEKERQEVLKEIFSNFARLNIVIMLAGKSTSFDNSGLVIAIADRIPRQHVDAMYIADAEHHKLMKEFAATGIEETLRKAGKRYFALSPRRQKDGSLRYWLNPMEQDKNNYGWFTLEDLKLWAENKGPIPMKGKK